MARTPLDGSTKQAGFTIVELLIVIVVIAILAAISIVAYNGIQERARMAKANSDLGLLMKAVTAARENESKTFGGATGVFYTTMTCSSKPAGTDLAALPVNDPCWVRYKETLRLLSVASGIDVNGVVDPYGRPYLIDENEGETGSPCVSHDRLGMYMYPANGSSDISSIAKRVPFSSFAGCS